ncbi:MAG: class I SAM-dependent methyltransferase [Lachnospiraceae bacterium]|nr:class I SAM-dependent methyltransferase [Lachnospiraceae bacterium]MDD3796013.1 class I SAM-dependent methyltransferase [Lachnospiraceae bacterium]
MQEQVGNVCLDYTWYPGEDLYSDGSIEDRLLEIAENNTEEQLNAVIDRERDWAVLYHLSHIRENIVDWLPMTKEETVLEIGSGCGAVTGALSRKAKQVTCVDLSKKRSLVNANRHREKENIKIMVGNFQDIEKNLTEKYDYVTLIGVFEYAQGYIGTEHPYEEFLRQSMSHLKPGGKLVIAIENRLGLKYWAGCSEDHTGKFFEGLENYPNPAGVHTFSRPELEKLFAKAEIRNYRFYYPYPDYKLPMTIYSDDYLPKKGELNTNIWNFDRERLVLFDESRVFDSLLESGLFPLYANSYLVVLERDKE